MSGGLDRCPRSIACARVKVQWLLWLGITRSPHVLAYKNHPMDWSGINLVLAFKWRLVRLPGHNAADIPIDLWPVRHDTVQQMWAGHSKCIHLFKAFWPVIWWGSHWMQKDRQVLSCMVSGQYTIKCNVWQQRTPEGTKSSQAQLIWYLATFASLLTCPLIMCCKTP